jgi:hypothetical protein
MLDYVQWDLIVLCVGLAVVSFQIGWWARRLWLEQSFLTENGDVVIPIDGTVYSFGHLGFV